MAYEADIQRLNISIQGREKLLEEEKLNDEQIKQLAADVGSRYLSNVFLKKLKDGECI